MVEPLATKRKRTQTFDSKLVHLLGAAARVFSEVGYDKASMRRVAAEAEVSLAGIYHYVGSKEELLYWIQFHTFDALLQGLQSCVEGIDDPRERLSAAIRNHVRHFGENMHALKVCARELESLEGAAYTDVHERRRAYFNGIHDIVKGTISRRSAGGPKPTSAPCPTCGALPPGLRQAIPHASVSSWLATANLFGMLNWFYQWYDAERTRVSLDDLAAQQTALFLDGYISSTSSDEQEGE